MAYSAIHNTTGVIVKVYLDIDYYRKLLECKNERDLLLEEKQKSFQIPHHTSDETQTGRGVNQSSQEAFKDQDILVEGSSSSDEQFGEGKKRKRSKKTQQSGNSSSSANKVKGQTFNESAFRKIIREELHAYFDKPPPSFLDALKNVKLGDVINSLGLPIPYLNQLRNLVGHGAERQIGAGTVDDDIAVAPIPSPPPPSFENTIAQISTLPSSPVLPHKSRSVYNKDKFLNCVPKNKHKKATELLDWLATKRKLVNWTKEGQLSINGQQIPNSDIYSVFKELYSSNPDTKVNGYVPLASLIFELNKGHLINKGKFWFITRKETNNQGQQTGSGYPTETEKRAAAKDWYFIEESSSAEED